MEHLLKEALVDWVAEARLDCSEQGVKGLLASGAWSAFDDVHVMNGLRKFRNECGDPVKKSLLRCILDRVPPKAVAEAEWLAESSKAKAKDFRDYVDLVKRKLPEWAASSGIPVEYWRVWAPDRASLTKMSASLSATEALTTGDGDQDKYEQAIRVLDSDGPKSSAIFELPRSLMSILTNYSLYALRVYVIPPEGTSVDRKDVRRLIARDLPFIKWK